MQEIVNPFEIEPIQPDIPAIVRRYMAGESVADLAKENKRCLATIYNWMFKEVGSEYKELVTECLINRVADADFILESAATKLDLIRGRALADLARRDLERRRPELYGPKQSTDSTVRVIIEPPPPRRQLANPPIDVTPTKEG